MSSSDQCLVALLLVTGLIGTAIAGALDRGFDGVYRSPRRGGLCWPTFAVC